MLLLLLNFWGYNRYYIIKLFDPDGVVAFVSFLKIYDANNIVLKT